MKNIVIFGAPGSGKGTQSDLMIEKYGFNHISTGDVLRNEIKNGTELGKTAKGFIDNGQLIPDELMIDILASVYDSFGKEHKGVIFDGFPRTIPQAEALDAALAKLGEKMAADFPLTSNFAIEMVQGMGQTVGQEVFDTCVWIGRFWEIALFAGVGIMDRQKIYRREEKLYLCGQLSAKDKNIRQALIDRYGGVGTKKEPGFFYVNGTKFAKDMWQAMAVATTFFDKYIRGIKL